MTRTLLCPYFLKAFSFSVPIGGLAGLVGLGGGEFRLPVLMRAIGFTARSAVPLNLTISLVTLAFALFARNHVLPVNVVTAHMPELLGLTLGGIASAFYGTNLVRRLSDRRLVSLISGLLISLGLLLIIEAFAAHSLAMNLTPEAGVRFLVGVAIGVGVGVVSSVLGVAGGELLIPALIFVFGADIRVAGTASLLISLAIVTTGVWRYYHSGAFPSGKGVQRIAISMSMGSIVGAALGGAAIVLAPADLLKVLLGSILIVTGAKGFDRPHFRGY